MPLPASHASWQVPWQTVPAGRHGPEDLGEQGRQRSAGKADDKRGQDGSDQTVVTKKQ